MRENKDKKKLCWNCEGNVSVQEENCPFCGVYLGPALSGREEDAPQPPYDQQYSYQEETIPPSPFAAQVSESESDAVIAAPPEEEKITTNSNKTTIIAMGLLSVGTIFFLFSLVLYFFSSNGVFTLKWNGESWYLYFLISIPTLFFGWKFLQYIEE